MSPHRQWVRAALRIGLCAVAIGLSMTTAAAEEPGVDVLENLRATAAALRTEGIKLGDADFYPVEDAQPPTAVAAAGPEFVAAWKEFRRCLAIRMKIAPQAAPKPPVNVALAPQAYRQLLVELVNGAKPPTPEQLGGFFYNDHSFCGNSSDPFNQVEERAVLLACLKHRRFGEAAKMVLEYTIDDQVQEDLLTALGFDWHKVLAGAWLDGRWGRLDDLCQRGNDETAQLVLRWAQLRWDAVIAKRGADRQNAAYVYDNIGPRLPVLELLRLLNPGNAVTDPTKERIGEFLNANGTRIDKLDLWIYALSRSAKGSAFWLKPMVRAGLQHEKNEIRSLSARLLNEAGEKDVKAELRAAPTFRLFVNGKAWPDFVTGLPRPGQPGGFRTDLSLSVEGSSGGDPHPDFNREGIIEPNADAFIPPEGIRRAYFRSSPISIGPEPLNPEAPWIRAAIPLPPAFGTTTNLHVDTVAVTIQPHYPRPLKEYKDKVTWVEFGFSEDERSGPTPGKYHLTGNDPLVLRCVQPGDYLIRVQAPGAAKTALQKVRVLPTATRLEPKLAIGSTVTVPLAWGAGLPVDAPEVNEAFRYRLWTDDRGVFRIERNGVPMAEADATDALSADREARKMDKMTLSNLPVGKYVVRLKSSDDLVFPANQASAADGAHASWKQAAVSFEITAKSPAEFTASALRIEPSH